MYKCFVCRYHEIATKGHNRSMFENKLINNIRTLAECDGIKDITLQRIRGRIFLRKLKNAEFTETELEQIKDVLSRSFGLESFSPVAECDPEPEKLFAAAVASAKIAIEKRLETASVVRFRTRARRSNKAYPLISQQIEIEMASRLHDIFGDRIKIDLDDPELTIGIEVREQMALIFHETFRGPGGLPVGTNSDVLALLSGGIDSPVACHMTMKRGCHVDFLTFHSFPYTPMMRIATTLCHFHKLHAIVTGESIGQVASQTIINLSVINDVTTMLMIRPLAGMDKLESIDRAMKIGTFDLSIEPQPDSCTVFAPPSPAVAAKYQLVEEEEKKIPGMEEALEHAFQTIEKFENL